MESFQNVNLQSLRDALPAIPFRAAAEAAAAAATPVARNANVLMNSITNGALKMNTYEFIQHISRYEYPTLPSLFVTIPAVNVLVVC